MEVESTEERDHVAAKAFCDALQPDETYLVYVFASWTNQHHRHLRCRTTAIDQASNSRTSATGVVNGISYSRIQVDGSEECMSICIGDDDDNNDDVDDSPPPRRLLVPDTLPTWMLFHTNPKGDIDDRRIVSDSVSSDELEREYYKMKLRYVPTNDDDYPRKTTTRTTNNNNNTAVTMRRASMNGDIPMSFLSNSASVNMTNDLTQQQQQQKKQTSASCLRIFVAGDRSSVGKSSVCLGILGTLMEQMGYMPHELAYIKPATQCEATTLVQQYCSSRGIDCVGVGPIVYYKGFTRAFLANAAAAAAAPNASNNDNPSRNDYPQSWVPSHLQPPSAASMELLEQAREAVQRLCSSVGRRVVLVDGVGYPAVGSITGTDNANVCRYACSYNDDDDDDGERRPPGVVLVGPSGVGHAVDSFHLNASYFEARGIPVLGGIFNKLNPDPSHYYSLAKCREQVGSYFEQYEAHHRPFGFVPLMEELSPTPPPPAPTAVTKGDDTNTTTTTTTTTTATSNTIGQDVIAKFISMFASHVNVQRILEEATKVMNGEGVSMMVASRGGVWPATVPRRAPSAPSTPMVVEDHNNEEQEGGEQKSLFKPSMNVSDRKRMSTAIMNSMTTNGTSNKRFKTTRNNNGSSGTTTTTKPFSFSRSAIEAQARAEGAKVGG